MRYKMIIAAALLFPLIGLAQTTAKHHKPKHIIKSYTVPKWAAAHQYTAEAPAYFPDFYTFYDPERGGYVFLENGKWSFTPTMPAYMSNKDLNRSRVQIIKGLNLDLQPQNDYPRYMKLYPPLPTNNNNDVPVPAAQGMSGAQ